LSWPFLFYGRRPNDWAEGANDGHLYELRFAGPPDTGAVAAAFERALHEGVAQAAPAPWRWSGPWALFSVGERRSGRPDAFFDAMERVLNAIHAASPLAEVVFWGARAPGTHPWDLWSLATQPVPTPGPPYPANELRPPRSYGQLRDPSLALAQPDAGFEAARKTTLA
jgi:hypothetical protein